jgi:hypothetical protein
MAFRSPFNFNRRRRVAAPPPAPGQPRGPAATPRTPRHLAGSPAASTRKPATTSHRDQFKTAPDGSSTNGDNTPASGFRLCGAAEKPTFKQAQDAHPRNPRGMIPRAIGAIIPDDLLAHVAPLGWEHIALTGNDVWTNHNAPSDFRSLRDVPELFLLQAA